MRSALICVFFWLAVHKHRCLVVAEEFYPTPIPLDEWHYDGWQGRSSATGLLEETIEDAPPAASPPHYWEDALRHSVYLTLVRDKIDQLITYDNANHHTNRDADDHDLWEKIKRAPFERIESEDPNSAGDVTVMSKGRLMEDNGGFRFTEDERGTEQCIRERCMDGARALWSVKRIRQLEPKSTPGKYHYELTFSVLSQTPKLKRKPHQIPTRTFTVREMAPEIIVDKPHEHRTTEATPVHTSRPGRALWFHKNIVPTQRHQARHYQYQHTIADRFFSSLFADDDYDVPQRHPPAPHPPPSYTQYSKQGYVGSPNDNQQIQQYKKYSPYTYKPNVSMKHSRPAMPYPSAPQPQHHYLDVDAIGVVSNPYVPQPPETRYYVPAKPVKTTRPAVLPTPVNLPSKKNNTTFLPTISPDIRKSNTTNYTIKPTEAYPTYTKQKQAPKPTEPYSTYTKHKPMSIKVSYFTDSVRPPVYNAPPGVFVTMDKKPFKPMPPLKLQHSPSKSSKPTKLVDFRPSPQVLDIQFSEPDPLFNGAFRPMAMKYPSTNTTEETESTIAESSKTEEQILVEDNNSTEQNGPKKQTKKKSQRITTTSTVASTTQAEENDFNLMWGNLLGAFTKTTPMEAPQEKVKITDHTDTENNSSATTTTEVPSTTKAYFVEKETSTTIASTTQKRTRPPPKYKSDKNNKIRKHKRVTSTTTQSPPTTTEKASDKIRKPVNDLTPQASSAAASGNRSTTRWAPTSTSTTTQTYISPIPTYTTTTTTEHQPSFTTDKQVLKQEIPLKNKNRYRQSTLMTKGTSVKHDKWSSGSNIDKTYSKTMTLPTGQYPLRRLESKFQGYTKPSTQQSYTSEIDEEDYDDYVFSTTSEQAKVINTAAPSIDTTETPTNKELDVLHNLHNEHKTKSEAQLEETEVEDDSEDYNKEENLEEESMRQSTVLLYPKSTASFYLNSNEIDREVSSKTEQSTVESSSYAPKNKTKCKKKKDKMTTPLPTYETEENRILSLTTTTTENTVTSDIFDELFGGFSSEASSDNIPTNFTSREDSDIYDDSSNHDYFKVEDLPDLFLKPFEGLDSKNNDSISDDLDYNEEDDEDDEVEDNDHDVEARTYDEEPSESKQDDEVVKESQPYNIFELLAME